MRKRQMHENMGGDTGWKKHIIGIEENDIFAGTGFKTLFRGEALTAIGASPQDRYARILFRDGKEYIRAFVRRSVVDDDALDVRIGLFEDGIDGLFQKPAVIVIDDDYAHQWQAEWRRNDLIASEVRAALIKKIHNGCFRGS